MRSVWVTGVPPTATAANSGTDELPIGIFTAAFGAPFFLRLLRRSQTLVAE